ncbi:sigma-70 family RNA polymerase sigma factor [Notoacmeibacter sp. MSK16QG-6]|uniref:sigma-70 family RNA polymerase sigma factor n=1 Tax=Notoacmeibacter sp. MSK16QG-6 TaxID=2957982 RepID=UPI0020A208DF|nr:sigma-70 family RNA polymerase sigma factor [Notoacmeibacter sp. MSK16QG-6]MCP1198090.1 sigma-70 family RNA polymerase sigma factor [Notoacmeibacter sp. MSK16QG-6]
MTAPPSTPDLDGLFAAGLDGDRIAYQRFLDEVARTMRAFLHKKMGSDKTADVEDVVQDVLIAVHTKRHSWRPEKPVAAWLFAIARYKAIDHWRSHSRHSHLDIADFESVLSDNQAEPVILNYELERAVGALSGRSRDVVSQISLKGQSISDTAKHLGMSEGAVRVAFHRGLSALSERFKDNDK